MLHRSILKKVSSISGAREKSYTVGSARWIGAGETPALVFITVRKRSLRRYCFQSCLSVQAGGRSLSSGGLSLAGLCPGGSLSKGISVQGVLCPRGPLSGGLCRGGGGNLCQGDPPAYGKERPVRILLECILVFKYLYLSMGPNHD